MRLSGDCINKGKNPPVSKDKICNFNHFIIPSFWHTKSAALRRRLSSPSSYTFRADYDKENFPDFDYDYPPEGWKNTARVIIVSLFLSVLCLNAKPRIYAEHEH